MVNAFPDKNADVLAIYAIMHEISSNSLDDLTFAFEGTAFTRPIETPENTASMRGDLVFPR